MRRLALVAILAALVLPACAGIHITPDMAAQAVCLASCQGGQCQKVETVWQCVKPPVDPCEGKAPLCVQQRDVNCWALNVRGECEFFPKEDPPPAVCPTCPAGYACSDPKVGCVKIPVVPPPPPPPTACAAEEDLTNDGVTQGPPQLQAKVREVIASLPDPKGKPVAETLEALAAGLRAGGLCAFAGSEAVFVRRTDGLFEEYHAVYFGNGGWTDSGSGKFMGLHRSTATPPAPPVTDACPAAPCPDRVWTAETLPAGWGQNAIGTARWKFNAKVHTMGNADSTPVVDRNEPFCAVIGLSPMAGGTLRASCPVRPDGHPERVAVEAWLLEGGPVRSSRNAQDCAPNNTDNPYAFLAGTGNCRICNTPGTVCSEWF